MSEIYRIKAAALQDPRLYNPIVTPSGRTIYEVYWGDDALVPPALVDRLGRRPTRAFRSNGAPPVFGVHGGTYQARESHHPLVLDHFLRSTGFSNEKIDRVFEGVRAEVAVSVATIEGPFDGPMDVLILEAIKVNIDVLRARICTLKASTILSAFSALGERAKIAEKPKSPDFRAF